MILKLIGLFFGIFLFGSTVFGFNQELYLSGMVGMGDVHIDVPGVSFDPTFNLGFRGGAVISENFTLGVFFLRSDNETTVNGSVSSNSVIATDFNALMAEATFYLEGVKNSGFFVSGLLGKVSLGTNGSGDEPSVGGLLGYNFMFGKNHSLGLQIGTIQTFGKKDKSGILFTGFLGYTWWF